ncbi:hypothetical protein WJX79_008586 [Trebouxia sp. C0005]
MEIRNRKGHLILAVLSGCGSSGPGGTKLILSRGMSASSGHIFWQWPLAAGAFSGVTFMPPEHKGVLICWPC